jgi:hypothetical protein
MTDTMRSAWLNVLNSVLQCCGDTPENRASYESCRATDPATISSDWWQELIKRCSYGEPEKFNQVVSDLVTLTKSAAPEPKPVVAVTPPLPKAKLDASRSRESLDATFQNFKWSEPEKNAYADKFGNLCGRLGPGD